MREGNYIADLLSGGHGFALFIMLMPLLTSLVLGIFGNWRTRAAGWLSTISTGIAFLFSLGLAITYFQDPVANIHELPWLEFGEGKIAFSMRLDGLSTVMFALITGISTLVNLFSIEYMRSEPNFNRYFAFLGLFTFSMLGLVLSNDLIFVFVFWELVGFCSYLLIGFWHKKKGPAYGSMKAFLVNRIGDLGFLIGLMILFSFAGTTNLSELFKLAESGQLNVPGGMWSVVLGVGLFMGAMGKSAQFPLSIWLPDAMAGPTPVSSMIHAATMVAAGVYLLARTHFMLVAEVLDFVAIIGAVTAFLAAVSALVQTDIKRVLAFSTISQLGFMVTGMGVGAVDGSLLHLFTHAFFKCGLFLVAGAIIHSRHQYHHELHKAGMDIDFDAQDMRLMGGLRKIMPKTFLFYLPLAAALAGIPLFSGFLSKDSILLGATNWAISGGSWHWLVPVLSFSAAGMTAFYITRQGLLVFAGEHRLPKVFPQVLERGRKIKAATPLMWIPLAILASLSLWVVFAFNPIAHLEHTFWAEHLAGEIVEQTRRWWVPALSVILALGAAGWAFLRCKKGQILAAAEPEPKGFRKMAYGSFNMDSLYEDVLVKGFLQLSRLLDFLNLDKLYEGVFLKGFLQMTKVLSFVDHKLVDGFVNAAAYVVARDPQKHTSVSQLMGRFDKGIVDGFVNGIANLLLRLGRATRRLQPGKVQTYLIFTVVGLLLLAGYLVTIALT